MDQSYKKIIIDKKQTFKIEKILSRQKRRGKNMAFVKVAYMDGEGFYVTLLSNSSTSFYPDNTIANFRTKLPQSLQFNVPYEVGIIEIQCPKTWTSFSLKDAEFVAFDKKTNRRSKLTAPLGFYTSMHQIIGKINECLSACVVRYGSQSIVFIIIPSQIECLFYR